MACLRCPLILSLAGEVNVIQVEAMTWKDSVKIPIATLKAGGVNNQVLLDLSFPDPPVTFTLVQGELFYLNA